MFKTPEEHYKLKHLGNSNSKSFSSVAKGGFTQWNVAACNMRHIKEEDV